MAYLGRLSFGPVLCSDDLGYPTDASGALASVAVSSRKKQTIKKKLLLVLPRNDRGFWGKVTQGKTGFVRLSLPTIAALMPDDWDVTIHDAREKPVDYDQRYDLVGVTGFTAEVPSAYGIADEFRRRGVPVIMGGVHASAMPDEALQHADAVVVGEAEGVWDEVLHDFGNGGLKPRYESKEKWAMQAMKFPRRDLLRREMYVSGFNTLQATRGCPFDCDYCSVTGVFGRQFRTRPVAEVAEEIRQFETRDFFFVDDNICGHPRYAKELFREIEPLGMNWGGQTSLTFAKDDELLELYARAGGRYAFIGFETISEENLAAINKRWNRANAYGEVIRKIHDAGINILGSFIVGLEHDDKTVFKRTLDFIMEHKIDAAQFNILTPFPGTRLYDEMDAKGLMLHHEWDRYHTSEVVFKPSRMTVDELQEGYYRLFRETYSIPNVLKRAFRSPRGIPFRLAMNYSYRKKAFRMPKARPLSAL